MRAAIPVLGFSINGSDPFDRFNHKQKFAMLPLLTLITKHCESNAGQRFDGAFWLEYFYISKRYFIKPENLYH